ncbi:MAG: hypothetical protein OHK0017_03890 [Patescibacteria group bacterium]
MTNINQLKQIAVEIFAECEKILIAKNHDYSDADDVFSNFKESGAVANVTPAQVALIQIGNKMSRLSQLIGQGKEPVNESTRDTIIDMINYLVLLKGILDENK